mmetsp:Transcript_8882/g.28187  ORF Transcript_8882/g.28187 Transcript_8882/m.28187 type:complete len:218 (+) Transcript_8882:126-779(+)
MSSSSSRPSRSASETLSAASASSASATCLPSQRRACCTTLSNIARGPLSCGATLLACSRCTVNTARIARRRTRCCSALCASSQLLCSPCLCRLRASSASRSRRLNRPSKKRGTATAESTATPVAAPNAAISATGELTATPERLLVMAAAAGGGSGDSGGGDGSVGGGGDGVDGRVGHSAALSLISHAPSLTRQADHKPETRTFARVAQFARETCEHP